MDTGGRRRKACGKINGLSESKHLSLQSLCHGLTANCFPSPRLRPSQWHIIIRAASETPKGQWDCYVSYLSVPEKSATSRGRDEERIRQRKAEGTEVHVVPEVTTETSVNKQRRRFTTQLKTCSERVCFLSKSLKQLLPDACSRDP